jgi:phage terminase small subunit
MAKPKVTTPAHLSNQAAAIYEQTIATYRIDDALGRTVLLTALEALDRLREAQKILKREGLTCRDRNGIVRPHPCTVIERNSRSAFLATFRVLGLEPPKVPK